MQRTAQFVLLLMSLLAGPGFDLGRLDASEPVRLRVLSYNIHHGRGSNGKIDFERLVVAGFARIQRFRRFG